MVMRVRKLFDARGKLEIVSLGSIKNAVVLNRNDFIKASIYSFGAQEVDVFCLCCCFMDGLNSLGKSGNPSHPRLSHHTLLSNNTMIKGRGAPVKNPSHLGLVPCVNDGFAL